MIAGLRAPGHVLLVEDDEIDIARMRRRLTKVMPQVSIEVAEDGVRALEMLRAREHATPPLIILDLNMPRMGGIEFLDAIRSDENLTKAVVFVLTTSDHEEDRTQAYERHVAGYLLKSERIDDIAAMFDRYLAVVRLP